MNMAMSSLESGIRDAQQPPPKPSPYNPDKHFNYFHAALTCGDFDEVERLIGLKADVNSPISNDENWYPLTFAINDRHQDIVELLLNKKAEPNRLTSNGWSPLMLSIGDDSLMEMLIRNNADVNYGWDNGYPPLMVATQKGLVYTMNHLLENGASVNHINRGGMSALHQAAKTGNIEAMKILIKHQANINLTSKNNRSILHCAANYGHFDAVKLLVDHKINVLNVQTKILALACPEGHGLDFWEKTCPPTYQSTGYICDTCGGGFLYKQSDDYHCPKCSFDMCTDCYDDQKAQDGSTAVLRAALNGHYEIVKFLIYHGADFTAPNNNGVRVVDAAAVLAHKFHKTALLDIVRRRFALLKAVFVDPDDISDISLLSSGFFGITYQAEFTVRPKDFKVSFPDGTSEFLEEPVKVPVVFKIPKFDRGQDEWFELEVLQNVPPHPNVLRLLGMCMAFEHNGKKSLAIMVPFKQGGSLKDYMMKQAESVWFKEIIDCAADMIKGVQHLHEHSYHHNDIALRNFLLTNNEECKTDPQIVVISDFGLSRPNGFVRTASSLLPWRWCSPEVIDSCGLQSSPLSDLWMYGIAVWELLNPHKVPFSWCTSISIFKNLIKANTAIDLLLTGSNGTGDNAEKEVESSDQLLAQLKKMIMGCCQIDPNSRFTPNKIHQMLEEMSKHPDIDKCVTATSHKAATETYVEDVANYVYIDESGTLQDYVYYNSEALNASDGNTSYQRSGSTDYSSVSVRQSADGNVENPRNSDERDVKENHQIDQTMDYADHANYDEFDMLSNTPPDEKKMEVLERQKERGPDLEQCNNCLDLTTKLDEQAALIADLRKQLGELKEVNQTHKRTITALNFSGYLTKKNPAGVGWKRRFCLISDFGLKYFQSDAQEVQKGLVSFSSMKAVQQSDKATEFWIEQRDSDRLYVFRAETREQRNDWVNMLRTKLIFQ